MAKSPVGPQTFKEIINEVISTLESGNLSPIKENITAVLATAAFTQFLNQKKVLLNERELNTLKQEIINDMIYFGPLQELIEDDTLNDILVNGPYDIYVERDGILEKTEKKFRDNEHAMLIAQKIANGAKRRIDDKSPMLDARLPDGSRVNVIIPPLSMNGVCISIRKFRTKSSINIEHYLKNGSVSAEMASLLYLIARSRSNVLISGGTGSGKTTLLNVISNFINKEERIITIEDSVELKLQQPHVLQLEARNSNTEGIGLVSLRDLVKNALRMRPDRIVLGEVRGEEAFDMLQAMNTGHDGSLSTVHANSPEDSLIRLQSMLRQAFSNYDTHAILSQIGGAIDFIIQIERLTNGKRVIRSISNTAYIDGNIHLGKLYEYDYITQTHYPTGKKVIDITKFERSGTIDKLRELNLCS